ncbi:MAG: acyl-CoA dehydrogenase, partial [Caulobacteraceae bacterium]|nr:acyl-CoA dehydrogenase [Caulobacteraceae bacterium]
MSYDPPIRDLLFALRAQAGFDRVQALDPAVDDAMVEAVLSAAGALTGGVLAPLNRGGDIAGAVLENGRVRAPDGFKAAWRAFAEGGWCGLSIPADRGGQGLPKMLEAAVYEMVHAANLSFGLCPTLSAGASETIELHGSEAQKAYYIPRLASGELTGAMALTEPQAGSDLSAVATRAEPDGEAWRLFGQKIFITWGDHDLTDNLVHLVLARLPGAPAGVKGISLFLAPRRLIGPDGEPGEANAIRVIGIEHKLGIHASPTCALAFEGARAELIGQPHQGLAYMFTMMNAARLHVGLQGVGIAERAWQKARTYAAERRQGRSVWTGEASAAIIDHPDVRLTLALTQARIEAARGLCLHVAAMDDIARLSPDAAEREAAAARAALLTPIAKSWSTQIGMQAASDGLQVHGGMGFIEATGAAQFYRDARIA